MDIINLKKTLPETEEELLNLFDEVAEKRSLLSEKIDKLSKQLGDSFSLVLKQRKSSYEPLDEELINKSSENDELINEYYELSSYMIAIENKLRDITKES